MTTLHCPLTHLVPSGAESGNSSSVSDNQTSIQAPVCLLFPLPTRGSLPSGFAASPRGRSWGPGSPSLETGSGVTCGSGEREVLTPLSGPRGSAASGPMHVTKCHTGTGFGTSAKPIRFQNSACQALESEVFPWEAKHSAKREPQPAHLPGIRFPG